MIKSPSIQVDKLLRGNIIRERAFKILAISALALAISALFILILDAFNDGVGRLGWQFITSFPSRKPEEAGILSALAGSLCVVSLTGLIAVPVGLGAAIYLEEYSRQNNWFVKLIEINILNLAGVPSVIYGLLGLELFVRAMRLGQSLLAGSLTMALLVLPIVIISSREALRIVPPSIREASYALGASRWQTVWHQVLPVAFPGVLTGSILALSRAIGEASPLITIGALTYIAFLPDSIMAPFTVLPIQIFNWVSRPQKGFFENAAAGILILLAVLIALNSLAIFLRQKLQKRLS